MWLFMGVKFVLLRCWKQVDRGY